MLGLSCGDRDLECLAGQKRAQVLELIEKAESIGFVGRRDGRVTFSHDVIRSAVLASDAAGSLRPLYEKLAECLAKLRPGDYSGTLS